MLWFLRDYPLAALLLRAATLAFDSLLIGGLVFCTMLLPRSISSSPTFAKFSPRALRLLRVGAIGLVAVQAIFVVLDTAMLMSTSGSGCVRAVYGELFSGGIAAVLYGSDISADDSAGTATESSVAVVSCAADVSPPYGRATVRHAWNIKFH